MEKFRYDKKTMEFIENAPVPFAVYQFLNRRVATIALSAGFCELFGYTDRAEAYYVMDNDMYRDAHPDDVSRISDAALRFATSEERYNVVYRSRRPGEESYTIVHAFGKHVYPKSGVRLAVVWYVDEGGFVRVTDDTRQELNRTFNSMFSEAEEFRENYYDLLTGLPNMTHFFDLADIGRKSMQEEGEQTAVLYIDLCNMKNFNRKSGFAAGDKLLRAVARLLANHFSNENCGRFGQDHFVVYTSARDLEKRLKNLFSECRKINGGHTLPMRVGIYLDEMEAVSAGTACDRAKMACDQSRGAFISTYRYFDRELLRDAVRRTYFLENIDRAIEEKWIRVYYQPIVRTTNGKVSDEEALARWVDPLHGVLAPAEFIPALEDALIAYKLDLYVVEQALRDMKAKERAGLYAVPVSVNLSRSDFEVCDIVEEIRARVAAAGVGPEKLNIEITESVIGRDYSYMKAQIKRFHELGFHVWMDDFGSGYSALDVLQSFDFDLIKFDMTFMRQFNSTEKSRIILTELMNMSTGLGIDTVVEGVEEDAQLRFLKEIGCNKVQGFYYSQPASLETIIDRYARGEGIGFENPEEADYYTTIGTINLDDPTVVNKIGGKDGHRYFQSAPMAIMEFHDTTVKILRCNAAYRDFLERSLDLELPDEEIAGLILTSTPSQVFLDAVHSTFSSGEWREIREQIKDNTAIHSFVRRLTVNPVTGAVAVTVLVLAMLD